MRRILFRYLRLPLALAAFAASPALAQVAVTDAWVRGTVAGQPATGAYMTLKSTMAATLVGAASPVANTVELHEMTMEGGVMRMRAIPRLPLPAGAAVALAPGGHHIMLTGLVRPLAEDEVVPITLTFEDGAGKKSTVEVKAAVRPLTAPVPMSGHRH